MTRLVKFGIAFVAGETIYNQDMFRSLGVQIPITLLVGGNNAKFYYRV